MEVYYSHKKKKNVVVPGSRPVFFISAPKNELLNYLVSDGTGTIVIEPPFDDIKKLSRPEMAFYIPIYKNLMCIMERIKETIWDRQLVCVIGQPLNEVMPPYSMNFGVQNMQIQFENQSNPKLSFYWGVKELSPAILDWVYNISCFVKNFFDYELEKIVLQCVSTKNFHGSLDAITDFGLYYYEYDGFPHLLVYAPNNAQAWKLMNLGLYTFGSEYVVKRGSSGAEGKTYQAGFVTVVSEDNSMILSTDAELTSLKHPCSTNFSHLNDLYDYVNKLMSSEKVDAADYTYGERFAPQIKEFKKRMKEGRVVLAPIERSTDLGLTNAPCDRFFAYAPHVFVAQMRSWDAFRAADYNMGGFSGVHRFLEAEVFGKLQDSRMVIFSKNAHLYGPEKPFSLSELETVLDSIDYSLIGSADTFLSEELKLKKKELLSKARNKIRPFQDGVYLNLLLAFHEELRINSKIIGRLRRLM